MHPGFYHWWKSIQQRAEDCGEYAGCGRQEGRRGHRAWGYEASHEYEGGGFGVRRPLRFLAYKLELEEPQVAELATILNDLKTERAQAAVDDRRTIASLADAVAGATFDDQKAGEAAALRVKSAERLKDAVLRSLGRIHAILNEEQRSKLAYLIRTGTVTL